MPPPEPGRPAPDPAPVLDQPPAAGRAIFIYYKVAQEDEARLQKAFARLVSASSKGTALFRHAQLLRRAGHPAAPQSEASQGGASQATPGLQTWMEVYWLDADLGAPQPCVDGAQAGWHHATIANEIDDRARAAGIAELVHGERHCEAFESCA